MKDLTITKHNSLVEASYKLSLNETRLILCCIGQVDSRKPIKGDEFTVTAAEFAERCGIKEKHAFEALKETEKTLFERKIFTYDGKYRDKFRWITSVRYYEGEAKISLRFSPEIRPYISLLHERFTSYSLKQVGSFKSAYAIRIYELLMQFRETGERVFTVEKFRDLLDLGDDYPRFSDLKKRVIDPAVNEINSKSDLRVTWEATRKGRTASSLAFKFKSINV